MTTASLPNHPAAKIEALSEVPGISVVRDFTATPAQLMRAHLDPDVFARWCGPAGTTVEIDVWDARPLGSYRYACVEEGTQHWFRGTFPTIRDDRLVQTFCYEPWPDAISLETMTFTDLGGGRTRLHGFSLFDSREARDGMLASGMDTGVNDGYAKLDALITEGSL